MPEPAIELNGVSCSLGRRPVLCGIDLAVPPASILGLVGLNGAGKTTTLRVTLGLLRPDSGAARVLGRSSARLAALSGRIGVSLHGVGLDPQLRAVDNLRLHALLHGRRGVDCEAVLERLELAAVATRRASRLSQGERQRLALARAILLRPDVLVLDEPLTHLDPGAIHGVLDVLREEVEDRGMAVLLSSHHLDHLERTVDSLALIHGGRILFHGAIDELVAAQRETLELEVDPVAVAERFLRADGRVAGVELLAGGGDGSGRLRVVLSGASPAELNAGLHESGVRVSLLAPERRSLHELFRNAVRNADHGGRQ